VVFRCTCIEIYRVDFDYLEMASVDDIIAGVEDMSIGTPYHAINIRI
jgi:hypothetical protein